MRFHPSGPPAVLLAAALLLGGCASHAAQDPPATEPTNGDPTALVGLWRVSDAAGADPDTWIRLGDDLELYQPCGWSSGDWEASGDAFLGQIWGWGGGCGAAAPVTPWLADATGYRVDGGGLELLDASGAALARLTLDGAPPHDPHVIDDYRTQPTMSPQLAGRLAPSSPAPSGFTAVEAAALVGDWVPAGTGSYGKAHLDFGSDGMLTGSDCANGVQGRWTLYGGAFLATTGPSTLIGCAGITNPNADAPIRIGQARTLALDDGELVLLDREGEEIGRFVRP